MIRYVGGLVVGGGFEGIVKMVDVVCFFVLIIGSYIEIMDWLELLRFGFGIDIRICA